LHSKSASRFAGSQVEGIKEVAKAYQNRLLKDFEGALVKYSNDLEKDPIIKSHLNSLYQTLLEQNLARIIEPFSRVEISHISELINLPVHQVEAKLSQMILDKVFFGIIDQGAGCLEIFDETPIDASLIVYFIVHFM
jgi:26S proteasome regulatory subunit N6